MQCKYVKREFLYYFGTYKIIIAVSRKIIIHDYKTPFIVASSRDEENFINLINKEILI